MKEPKTALGVGVSQFRGSVSSLRESSLSKSSKVAVEAKGNEKTEVGGAYDAVKGWTQQALKQVPERIGEVVRNPPPIPVPGWGPGWMGLGGVRGPGGIRVPVGL